MFPTHLNPNNLFFYITSNVTPIQVYPRLKDLTVIHVMRFREHNLIAKELSNLQLIQGANLIQYWTGKTSSKRLGKLWLPSEHQHITYNEFLPEIVNQSFVSANNLINKCPFWVFVLWGSALLLVRSCQIELSRFEH